MIDSTRVSVNFRAFSFHYENSRADVICIFIYNKHVLRLKFALQCSVVINILLGVNA